jgi:hypothetical protein
MATIATSATLSMSKPKTLKEHNCCYYECPEPGTVYIGPNGGDSHWICFRHFDRWNQNRVRFLADGGGCEMQELGELLEEE